MKKIKTVFVIDREAGLAINEVVPESEWVINGDGVATIKFDGTSCMIRDGKLFKRYDAKAGRTPPAGWEPCEDAPDPKTGHHPGWVEAVADAPENRFHREAFEGGNFENGTYELVGPKISSTTHNWIKGKFVRCGSVTNRYNLERHELWRHGTEVVENFPRTFEGMREWFEEHEVEGIVFHHEDGRFAKIRRKDFGIVW